MDDVWADTPRISLGENLYISKIDFQPFTKNHNFSDQDKYWTIGVSRVNKFKGMKRGASLNRTLDIFIVMHNHPYRLKNDKIEYYDKTKLSKTGDSLVVNLARIRKERDYDDAAIFGQKRILSPGGTNETFNPANPKNPDENSLKVFGINDDKSLSVRKKIQKAEIGSHNKTLTSVKSKNLSKVPVIESKNNKGNTEKQMKTANKKIIGKRKRLVESSNSQKKQKYSIFNDGRLAEISESRSS